MRHYLPRLLALLLVAVIGLVGCSDVGGNSSLTGNYKQDTLNLVETLRYTIELPQDAPEKRQAQSEAREKINEFASLYRRDDSVSGLPSFTTMRTALNALAAHYSKYTNRPLPPKVKKRVEYELNQVEAALKRGS